MKKLLLLAPALLLFSFNGTKTGPTQKEKKLAISYLNETKDLLAKTIAGLTEEQLNFKAAPDHWSVKECVQHIAIAEDGLWMACDGVLKSAAAPEKRSEIKFTDEQIMNMITDRSHKVKTTEQMQPDKSPYATTAEAFDGFSASRKKLVQYIKKTNDDMRNHIWESPLGMMDSYQMVLFIAAHTKRHTLQIEEVKADAGFPK